jgi:hypothetical protein
MASKLDRQIEQLENIVEKHLDLCEATWNETRCTLPRNHEQTAPHKFRIEFLKTTGCSGATVPLQNGPPGGNRKE